MRFDKAFIYRFVKFGAVGGLGVFVNIAFYAICREYFSLADFLSRAIAIEISILHNFLWSYFWVWSQQDKSGFFTSIVKYHASTLFNSFIITLAAGWLILKLLPEFQFADYLSHIGGIAVGMVSNYLFAEFWVFRKKVNKQ